MPEEILLLVILGGLILISGPVALIISIANSKRLSSIEESLTAKKQTPPARPEKSAFSSKEAQLSSAPEKAGQPPHFAEPAPPKEIKPESIAAPQVEKKEQLPPPLPIQSPEEVTVPPAAQPEKISLEERLGTRWMAIAGAVAFIIGVIIGLKYMYDNSMIGPMGRTIIVAGWGIAAIVVGQITRVRGYDIVAKSLTALGFALLYAADFAAFGFYKLIGAEPAFVMALLITAGGVLYAVSLNEVVMAFLAMLGGYLSPVMLSSGQNKPDSLFGYVTILSVGVMISAIWRKWRSVNILAFAGTAILYGAWFYKYYDAFQNAPAITWLGIFFVIFLTLPVMHELWRGVQAKREDVLLVLANAMFCFGYLSTMLWREHREYLALAGVILGAAHLAMMAIVHKRSPQDKALKVVLGLIGIAFFTIAMGLYLKINALTMAYFAEAVVLTVIAVRYRSLAAVLSSLAAAALAVTMLLKNLPLHGGAFRFIFNDQFGIWVFGSAAVYACGMAYRKARDEITPARGLAQLYFCGAIIILLATACMEWYWHCYYNKYDAMEAANHGIMVVLAAGIVLSVLPRFKPSGAGPFILSVALALGTFTLTSAEMFKTDRQYFQLWNSYLIAGCITAILFYVCSLMHRFIRYDETGPNKPVFVQIFFVAALMLLFMALHNEWYEYWSKFGVSTSNPNYLRGLLCGLLVFSVGAVLPKFSPAGQMPVILSCLLLIGAMLFSAYKITDLNWGAQYVYLNTGFLYVISPAVAAVIVGYLLKTRHSLDDQSRRKLAGGCYLAVIFFLWIVLTRQMYQFWRYWQYNPKGFEIVDTLNIDKGQMWVSILWAVYAAAIMIIGLWRKLVVLRYIGFAVITITAIKVLLYDTRKLEGLYQIASFIMLGLVLIGLSYLYQFLRKKGFFAAAKDGVKTL